MDVSNGATGGEIVRVYTQANYGGGFGAGNSAGLGFAFNNANNVETQVAAILSSLVTNTAGSESGDLVLGVKNAGSWNYPVRITNTGNVGIGTTAPVSSLQISGSRSGSGLTQSLVINDTWSNPTSGGGREGIDVTPNSTNTGAGNIDVTRGIVINNPTFTGSHVNLIGLAIAEMTSGSNNADLLIGSVGAYLNPSGNFALYSASTRNSYFAGNLGIGTAGPSAKLQISKDGSNGAGGLGDYGIVTTASSGQATLGAEYIGDGYANLNLGQNNGGTRRFWHISSRLSSTSSPYSLEIYNYTSAGSFSGPLFTFTTTGNLGIGTANPACSLHVVDGPGWNDGIRLEYTSSYITKFVRDGTYFYIVDGSNTGVNLANGATAWAAQSDIRSKRNVKTIDSALDKIMSIRGVYFNWKNEKAPQAKQVGVIAQEVEKHCPEIVSSDDKGYKSVAYSMLTPYLIEAIKEQQKQIEELRQQLQQLKRK